ncbi:unnamed protein product [Sphagnum jensenii]|uniref:Uncharacterized protein n=1 Tax=Sphagnum jensenii TaxID=128206 RepID=A0ABP0VID1_9BRYO
MYGQEFMIQNATFSRVYGMDTSAQVASNSPINVTLTTLCTDQTTVVPLLGYQNLDVYMNGHRMIPGIDYAANPMVDANNNPALVQVIICNRQWLSLTGTNYVEVIAHTSTVYALDVGYAANNKLNNQNNIALWYSGLSAVFVGGVLQNGACCKMV